MNSHNQDQKFNEGKSTDSEGSAPTQAPKIDHKLAGTDVNMKPDAGKSEVKR